MEKMNFVVLDCIEYIHEKSDDSKLSADFIQEIKPEAENLANYLGVSVFQAVLFANAFVIGYDESNFHRVFGYLNMKEFNVDRYYKDIEELFSKKLLKKERSRNKIGFSIPKEVLMCIRENKNIEFSPDEEKTFMSLLEEMNELKNDYIELGISFIEFRMYMIDMISEESFPMIGWINSLKLEVDENYFLLDSIWDAINANDNDYNTDIFRTCEDYYKSKGKSKSWAQDIINGKSNLILKDLIECKGNQFMNRSYCRLSDKVMDMLEEKEQILLERYKAKEETSVLRHEDLKEKKLFYNEKENKELHTIEHLIQDKNFLILQNKLKDRAMPIGISILLYGAPGTGKTESVYQLAKKSGRSIFQVDISKTKSMWFGESQKLTKKIFEDYRKFKDSEKRCPILLFNEADAVIGKRKVAGSTNTADTENAIQNILLEEMEKFDGIMMATTNLVDNLDAAFERRFLYKIRFEKPSAENAAKIWKSKIPMLTKKEALSLANEFDFSGGELENIARKVLLNDLIHHELPNYDNIYDLAKNEKWSSQGGEGRIGFGK